MTTVAAAQPGNRPRAPFPVEKEFGAAVDDGTADLPMPGAGRTAERWNRLADVAERDLDLGRLVEAHTDALAILAELAGPEYRAGQRWGVWAAEASEPLRAECTGGRWLLDGTKTWCSGAGLCTDALVTAHADDGVRLFAVSLDSPGVASDAAGWTGLGMAGCDTRSVHFDRVRAVAVGGPCSYLNRPGFWHGAIGVAACWYGGARGVAMALLRSVRNGRRDPHALAHLGAVDAALGGARAALRAAAAAIDADPEGPPEAGERRAFAVRAIVDRTVADVLTRVARATGPAPLAADAEHAKRVADLTVYVRQNHAERDLARLGELTAAGEDRPW